MKRLLTFQSLAATLLFLVFGLSSCTKYSFMPLEEKIIGIWDFENVMYRPGPFKSRQNITWQYQQFEYDFQYTGDFIMTDKTTGSAFLGRWTMTELSTGYDNTETTYTLHISVYNPSTGSVEQMVWEVESINAKRLRATETWGAEEWTYRMARQD